jgi:hypothetical protein
MNGTNSGFLYCITMHNIEIIWGTDSVVDPKLIFPDPDPTLTLISDPDSDPDSNPDPACL